MNKPPSAKARPDVPDDAPVRRSDIAAGRLVLRKRDQNGAVLPRPTRQS